MTDDETDETNGKINGRRNCSGCVFLSQSTFSQFSDEEVRISTTKSSAKNVSSKNAKNTRIKDRR